MCAEEHGLPAGQVHAVVVTYQPPSVGELLTMLTEQGAVVTVVDNGSTPERLARLRDQCEESGASLVALPENLGIAAAQNIGIRRALEMGAAHVLLSDQDSRPAPDMLSLLLAAILEDSRIAATGPLPAENREGADELVYVDRGWSPKRATKTELSQPRLETAFLIASGCLIRREALEDVGLMREDLFIDHVDLEWGVRARRHGWRLIAVPGARLVHSLGDEVVHLPGRDQPVHIHSPLRNYYIVRNTIALVRSGELPVRWRVRYSYWATTYTVFNAFLAGRGSERRRLLARGIHDGLRGRLGPLSLSQ